MVEDLRVPATELGIDLAGVKAIDSRGDLDVTHGISDSHLKIDGDTVQVDSPRTAEGKGSRPLKNVKAQRALSMAIDRRVAKVEIDQQWAPSRLALVVQRCLQNEQL